MSIVLYTSLKEINKAERLIKKYSYGHIQWHVYIYLKQVYMSCDHSSKYGGMSADVAAPTSGTRKNCRQPTYLPTTMI